MTSQVPSHETIHPRYGALVAVSKQDNSDQGMMAAFVAFGVGGAALFGLYAWVGFVGLAIGVPLAAIAMVVTAGVVSSRERRYELYADGFVERVGGSVVIDLPLGSIVSLEAVQYLDATRQPVVDAVELVAKDATFTLTRCDAVEQLAERAGFPLRAPRQIPEQSG